MPMNPRNTLRPTNSASANAPRVLFVDDDPDFGELLVWNLEHYCAIQSTLAVSALHALQVLNREEFDLVVSDLHMPGMNGVSFLLIAAERWPVMRRILFTSHTTADLVLENSDYIDEIMDKALGLEFVAEKICRHAKTKRIQ